MVTQSGAILCFFGRGGEWLGWVVLGRF